MDPEQFSVFRHEAVHQLMEFNEVCKKAFSITSWQRWEYELDEGTLTFSENGIPKVIATIQVVGTTSKSGGTWLWAWANQNLPARVTKAVERVRAFGETENIPELTEKCLPDDEYLGWEMTAVAAKLLGSKGAYRCPGDNGFVYVVYSSLRFADEHVTPSDEPKQIECATHGNGFSTYVCEHLVANPAQEWFSEQSEDSKWPDAWCSTCNSYFLEEGEWNEKNEAKLKIKLLCHFCYEKKRSQETFNAGVP